MTKSFRAFVLGALFLLLTSVPALAHFQGYSAVDAMEIRWGGSTQYTTARDHSISTWNALGKVNIAPDTIWTYEDITYSDVNRSDVTWCGVYVYYGVGSDDIQFNIYYFTTMNDDQDKFCALQEMGHALGLAHSFNGNVMYGDVNTGQPYLGTHDKEDYSTLYP